MTGVRLLSTLLLNRDHNGCTFVWILLSYVEELSTIRCQFGPRLLPATATRHVIFLGALTFYISALEILLLTYLL